MGPTILLDKSALECLSIEEISVLSKYYYLLVTPTLIFEIMGDISKPPQKGILSKDKVSQLSQKILSTDGFMNINYQSLCLANLLGYDVPMTGKPVVEPGVSLKTSTGQKFIFFDEPLVRKVLQDWSNGNFTEAEENTSKRWREALKKLNLEPFQGEVSKSFEKVPKMKTLSELKAFLDEKISNPDPGIQWENIANVFHAFIESWAFTMNLQDQALKDINTLIYNRWHKDQLPTLAVFASYANYLLKVSYLFSFGLHSRLLTPKRSNAFDIEYLYYLPFCMVFSSGDNFHVEAAPLLLRRDQQFIHRDELKKDLKGLKED
ncbi:MAG: hypothetical protein RBG1_1C00001G0915 [candidate division Zixibacteria bacterium RBG-1]|nr:MAG: hypothetical protein RBG1_1C00001G0915 [candidate division Zixibacteria bacterium RBG-1]